MTPKSLGDGVTAFEIRTQRNQDLRELICQRVVKNGWTIRRLDLQRRKLEDHFINVVMREEEEGFEDGEEEVAETEASMSG